MIKAGYAELQRGWQHPPATGGAPVPPSLELYVEAVHRASAVRYTTPAQVTNSLLAGRWPAKTDE